MQFKFFLPKGRKLVEDDDTLLLPSLGLHDSSSPCTVHTSDTPKCTPGSIEGKRSRLGKGSHILTLVHKFHNEPENWKWMQRNVTSFQVCSQKPVLNNFTILRITPNSVRSVMMFIHFMWKDIQLSKGQLNKKRLITAAIAGKKEEIYYSSAPCLCVKVRPHKNCDFVVPIRDKQCCPEHNLPLQRTSECPVEFVYVHPKDPNDKRRVTALSKGSI